MAQVVRGDERKLQELILYVAAKCQRDPLFGAVKLNKILFLSDFLAYARLGAPITGVEYMKLPLGPAPKYLAPIREEMVRRGDIALEKRDVFSFPENPQVRIVPQRRANLSLFTAEEIAFVDSVLEACLGLTGHDLSETTHELPAWRVAANRETIPYAAIFVSPSPLSIEERELAMQIAQRHGWA